MLSLSELCPVVEGWLQAVGAVKHRTARLVLAQLVTAVVVGQSLRASSLMRTLLSDEVVPARQRYKRVAGSWQRRWLTSARLSPSLVRAALAVIPPDPVGWPMAGLTQVALDRVRCGGWEIFTLGVVWHGRVLPIAWEVLAYPWPKRRFTPTVCRLVEQVAAVWPTDRPCHLVADRAFASRAFLLTLRAGGWSYTLRLRAPTPLTVDGRATTGRDQVALATPTGWAAYGTGPSAIPGTLVIGQGLPTIPWHQRGPASLAARARRAAHRQQHLASKHPGRRSDRSAETDGWVLLFTPHPTWHRAVTSSRRRWAIEGSYRDAQGGWDGQHGWDLEPALARRPDATQVAAVVGLWALATHLQSWLGDRVTSPDAPAQVRARHRLDHVRPPQRLGPWPLRPDRALRTLQALAPRLPAPGRRPPPRRAATRHGPGQTPCRLTNLSRQKIRPTPIGLSPARRLVT